jgi:hypothetical protein
MGWHFHNAFIPSFSKDRDVINRQLSDYIQLRLSSRRWRFTPDLRKLCLQFITIGPVLRSLSPESRASGKHIPTGSQLSNRFSQAMAMAIYTAVTILHRFGFSVTQQDTDLPFL